MKGVSGKRWILLSERINPPSDLVRKLGKVMAQILANRNFESYVEYIFDVKLRNLLPYKFIPNIEEASLRIKRAIDKEERVVIFGDYDVDGITATAILYDFLKNLKTRVVPIIPPRNMGYGLSGSMAKLLSRYADLLITVDNGTSAVKEINNMDIDVIVIDHHNPSSVLPNAIVVNPKISERVPKELKEISSSALAFYVVASLRSLINVNLDIRNYIDLVALGTVADVMPLNYLNRTFVVKGVELLNSIIGGYLEKPGIRALLEVSSIEKVSFRDISFSIAPRLNSAGRIGDPKISLNLLIENNYDRAKVYARKLEALNISRRKLSENILKEVYSMLDTEDNFLCASSPQWHTGILGIVAGRIARKFSKPAGIFKETRDKITGSVRSIEGINIYSLFSEIKDMFIKWGGHSFAVGITLPANKFDEFREIVNYMLRDYEKNMGVLEVDMELDPSEITENISEMILSLQPFGEGNNVPTFLANVYKFHSEKVSKGKYKVIMEEVEMDCYDYRIIEAMERGSRRIIYSFDGGRFELMDAEYV